MAASPSLSTPCNQQAEAAATDAKDIPGSSQRRVRALQETKTNVAIRAGKREEPNTRRRRRRRGPHNRDDEEGASSHGKLIPRFRYLSEMGPVKRMSSLRGRERGGVMTEGSCLCEGEYVRIVGN